VRRFLGPFLQDTWKAWLETEGERMAAELDRLAEQAIEVANQRVEGLTREIAKELSSPEARLHISVDTFKYDASVFALGALGTTVFLFVNTLAGGLMTLAAPVLALIFRGKVAQEVKAEARQAAPEAVKQGRGCAGTQAGPHRRRIRAATAGIHRRGWRGPGARGSPRCWSARWPSAAVTPNQWHPVPRPSTNRCSRSEPSKSESRK